MTVIRDSGYKQAPSGNVAVDFVYGNLPLQTNDDRTGTSPVTYNATGGTTGSAGSDIDTAVVTAASGDGTTITYTAANNFNAGQLVTVTGLSSTVAITGITASAGVVTYATSSTTGLSAGQTIVITGASTSGFNGTKTILAVTTNTNFTVTSAATGSTSTATGTYTSAYNKTSATIATASSSNFTVTSSTQDRAVSGATGKAAVNLEVIPGFGADYGWGTTTDYASYTIAAADLTKAVGQVTLTVPSDNHVRAINGWDAFPQNTSNGGFNPATKLYATVTAVSASGGTVTYTANNNFQSGQTVTITGLYNYVAAGSTQPIATQYYAPTYTTASAFNLSGVTVASATATQFTVTNAATDSALAGVAGNAVVTIAAVTSSQTVPTVTGLTVKEADRLLGNADFDTGTVTYTTSGATLANAGTVYSQSITGSQSTGTPVNLVVYKLATGENPGTQDGTFTYVC